MSAVDSVIGSLTAQQAVVLISLPLFSTSISFRAEIDRDVQPCYGSSELNSYQQWPITCQYQNVESKELYGQLYPYCTKLVTLLTNEAMFMSQPVNIASLVSKLIWIYFYEQIQTPEPLKELSWNNVCFDHRRTGRGRGRVGLQPPQILDNSDFLGSKRKFRQRQLLKTLSCFSISILKR